jgi:hypothetical protein
MSEIPCCQPALDKASPRIHIGLPHATGMLLVIALLQGDICAARRALAQTPQQSEAKTEASTTFSVHQMPPQVRQKEESTTPSGSYSKNRLISPLQPVVVRQESPNGPRYQEALGYTFLLYSAKFPSVARIGDGRLVLNLSYEAADGSRRWVLLYSGDEGMSWGHARLSPVGRSTLVSLGGNRLMAVMVSLQQICFSDDGGATWKGAEPILKLSDGRTLNTDVPYTRLVEGQTVTFMTYVEEQPGYSHWEDSTDIWTRAVMRRYHLDTHTWDEPYLFPREWGLCEGAVTRAKNGDLVAAFRTQMRGGEHADTDHWMGLATSRSTDNGKTWSPPVHHFRYGYHHVSLLNLPDGRILMTYAARVGELDGKPYHGVEAMISHDNGATWDWQHRYILFRWLNCQSTHSPGSALLSDGRILTIFLHDAFFTYVDESIPGSAERKMGNVSAVIWRPQTENEAGKAR